MSAPVTVGVLGGGQLGRMMAQAAHRLGIKLLVLDPAGTQSPAALVCGNAIAGSFDQNDHVIRLAEMSDVVTIEIEHVHVSALKEVEKRSFDSSNNNNNSCTNGIATATTTTTTTTTTATSKTSKSVPVYPNPRTIELIQDKYQQKVFLQSHNIPVADFLIINNLHDLQQAAVKFGYPLMLKQRRWAYDGKGNGVIRDANEMTRVYETMSQNDQKQSTVGGLYVEKWVPFVKELAVMVARSTTGEIAVYPVVESIQHNNICHTVLAPALVSLAVQQQVIKMAEAIMTKLDSVGIFGLEMFLTQNNQEQEVLLNEIAPRPHNSGHYTIEACYTDQFEQHLRAVLGLPLGLASMKVGASMMVNILGSNSMEETLAAINSGLSVPGASIHWYGKTSSRSGRKMGHITIVADNMNQLQQRVALLQAKGKIDTLQEMKFDDSSSNHTNKNNSSGSSSSSSNTNNQSPLVGIIMGSDSDLPTMKEAAEILDIFRVPYELTVVSAHRTPQRMFEYAQQAHSRGLKVIIAGAGGAAHLPGMVASLTPLPVIGVPIKTSTLNGNDSLLSIVQMPRGIPVATVAIGNGANAGLLAVRQLAPFDAKLMDLLIKYHEDMRTTVEKKAEKLEQVGYEEYLKNHLAKH